MLLVAAVLLAVALVCHFAGRELSSALGNLKSGIHDTLSSEEIGDVEGYGVLISGIGYLAGVGLMALLAILGLIGGTVFMLPITVVLGTVLFFGIRNTYTYRIKQDMAENDRQVVAENARS